ncbi:MAG: hypothetical protein RLZZ401_1854 [Pseudomonadota bacterium]
MLAALMALAGCGSAPVLPPALPPHRFFLLGEQHDAPEHQQLALQMALQLSASSRLNALALEMAEQGRSTQGLPSDASEATVRTALAWDGRGWPWAHYGPLVMATVRAGVPVVGANLPRGTLQNAMKNEALDGALTAETHEKHLNNVRDGHCNLLPEAQLASMVRVQIARDLAMAETLARLDTAAGPGQVTLLLAGSTHVNRRLGIPLHLPAASLVSVLMQAGGPGDAQPGFDTVWPTPPVPATDYCAGMVLRPPRPDPSPAPPPAPADR